MRKFSNLGHKAVLEILEATAEQIASSENFSIDAPAADQRLNQLSALDPAATRWSLFGAIRLATKSFVSSPGGEFFDNWLWEKVCWFVDEKLRTTRNFHQGLVSFNYQGHTKVVGLLKECIEDLQKILSNNQTNVSS